jgi:hypothetical protein
MAKLKDKVQNALDEVRMLVLGLQVLIAFDYRAALEPGFERLPPSAQQLKLVSLSLLLFAFGLILAPGADHRLCERGEDTPEFHRLTNRFASLALLPFAIAMALDFAVAVSKLSTLRSGLWAGSVLAMVAIGMWYALEVVARRRENGVVTKSEDEDQPAGISDKIRHVLTEARVVLPGAQALLGFQFASMLADGFDKLPPAMKWLHVASLSVVALATILLIAPAAWHRIVEQGEETERFHRIASRFVVAALIPLGLGLVGDFYLVVDKVTRSSAIAATMAAALALLFAGLWFGIGLVRRRSAPRISELRHA